MIYNSAMSKRIKEGHRVKDLNPFDTFIPFVMVERNDSQNTINESFEIAPVEEFIKEMRGEGLEGFGVLHVILASYVRMVSQRPRTNRYIRGQRIWARNEITVSLAIMRKMSIDGVETTIKMHFKPEYNVYQVYDEVSRAIASGMKETNTDSAAKVLTKIPRLILKFSMWALKTLDYFNLLLPSLKEASPFHASMFITNMASLNIPPIRHHLYNFGNCPLFIAFGAKRTIYDFTEDGDPFKKRVVDFTVNIDERTTNGYYWASSLKMFKHYLAHPELLKEKPECVVEDK